MVRLCCVTALVVDVFVLTLVGVVDVSTCDGCGDSCCMRSFVRGRPIRYRLQS